MHNHIQSVEFGCSEHRCVWLIHIGFDNIYIHMKACVSNVNFIVLRIQLKTIVIELVKFTCYEHVCYLVRDNQSLFVTTHSRQCCFLDQGLFLLGHPPPSRVWRGPSPLHSSHWTHSLSIWMWMFSKPMWLNHTHMCSEQPNPCCNFRTLSKVFEKQLFKRFLKLQHAIVYA